MTVAEARDSQTNVARGEALLKALRSRRSIGKVSDVAPDRELIWQILEAATWAPNHHLTEPWRFFVLEGDARNALGRVMGEVAAARESNPDAKERVAASAAKKPLRAPYVIAVGVEPSNDSPWIEEVAAGAAAVQNMLLAADALGLGAIWRSGWIAFEPEIRDHFGLSDRGQILGFVYVGHPLAQPGSRERRPVAEVTTWLQD